MTRSTPVRTSLDGPALAGAQRRGSSHQTNKSAPQMHPRLGTYWARNEEGPSEEGPDLR